MKFLKQHLLFFILLLIICTGCIYWFYWHLKPFTSNAFVFANSRPVTPLVGGYITHIHVKNNQFVKKGDPLFTIYETPYKLKKAELHCAAERILIAGDVTVTEEAAEVFAKAGVKLLGNEGQTVGPKDAPMKVHLILLGAGTVLLEGIVLEGVTEGKYFLSALPLNISGFEGSPCRAYLIEE